MARPKKIVALFSADVALGFVLNNEPRWRVHRYEEPMDFYLEVRELQPHAIVLDCRAPLMRWLNWKALQGLRDKQGQAANVVVIAKDNPCSAQSLGVVLWVRADGTALVWNVKEALKTACARKRGPRLGSLHLPKGPSPVRAEAALELAAVK